MKRISTQPGESGPFAPPAGWDGDSEDYRELIRERYRNDLASRQQIGVVALRLHAISFTGHWAIEARAIAKSIIEKQGRAA
jgi:hypothetical protein